MFDSASTIAATTASRIAAARPNLGTGMPLTPFEEVLLWSFTGVTILVVVGYIGWMFYDERRRANRKNRV